MPRQFRQLPGHLLGQDRIRGEATPVKEPDAPKLLRPEPIQVSIDPLDGDASSKLLILCPPDPRRCSSRVSNPFPDGKRRESVAPCPLIFTPP